MKSKLQKSNILINFEKYCYFNLYKTYNVTSSSLNKIIISNIIYNNRLHIVSCFKEFLIYYDPGDFLSSYYKRKESRFKIKDYSEFYTLNSRIFPNYILLPESKYIFNNIKKKQKLLDQLEENNNKYYNENSQNLIMNYSDMNNYNRSLQLNRTQSSYFSTIFTPSILNSILNERESTNKNEDNTSNISNINCIIDNINKNQKNKRNLLLYKTPKNKIINSNISENGKNSISSMDLFLNDKNNNLNNSIQKNKGNNNMMKKYNMNNIKEKEKNKSKTSKDKLPNFEFSNDKFKKSIKNSRQQNAPKKFKNTNIHKKTQSNENIRNDINVFQDNETINNKISMLLKTNCEIKSIKNNIYSENNTNIAKNKKNNNLQRYIQHITKISKGTKKNNITINKASMKNSKMVLKKTTTSKNNTTYTNKTQSQPSISFHHKKVTTITKSMPKLSTYFDNNIKKNQYSKNNLHNQLFNFPSGYQSLKNTNINSNSYYYNSKKSKNKISNRKNSHKVTKNIKDKSLTNFYQIIQKNIDSNIKYNINNIKNNYISTGKPKINHANKNKNKKNSLIPSLHISLGAIMNNNNTFIRIGNQSLSKSKSKSRSKSKSINKSNSIIKIIDDNSRHKLYIGQKIENINKIKLNMNKQIHKTHDGLQTERIKNSNNLKSNKVNNIPKITFDVNINNNVKKQTENRMTINISKNKTKEIKNKNDTTENLHINLQGNTNNKYMSNRFPQSARNKNNINNLNNNKNSNFCSETDLQNNQPKPTTHRVFNKFNFQNQSKKKKVQENSREIVSTKNKNVYLIHNYNINNVNDNINFFSQQNLKSTFNKNVLSKRNSMNQEQGTNIIININNNIFQNNKNNFNYNNYIYNSSVNNNNCSSNKKYNIKNIIKGNTNSKNSKIINKDNK